MNTNPGCLSQPSPSQIHTDPACATESNNNWAVSLEHYAHYAHLAADAAQHVQHEAAVAATVLIRTHAQMAYDLARLHRTMVRLAIASMGRGARSLRALQELRKLRILRNTWLQAFDAERASAAEARAILGEVSHVAAVATTLGRSALRGTQIGAELLMHGQVSSGTVRASQMGAELATAGAASRIGDAALRLRVVLRASRIGSGLLSAGRIIASEPVVYGLVAVAGAAAAVESFENSSATTFKGKIANGLLGGTAHALPLLKPRTAIVDLVLPHDYKLSTQLGGTADAVVTIGESLASGRDRDTAAVEAFHRRSRAGGVGKPMQFASELGDFFADTVPAAITALRKNDSRPLDSVHQRSMQGTYGKVLQLASEAGEFWAAKGIAGGLKEFGDSLRWWVSH